MRFRPPLPKAEEPDAVALLLFIAVRGSELRNSNVIGLFSGCGQVGLVELGLEDSISILLAVGRSNCGGLEPRWSKSSSRDGSDSISAISGGIGVH